MKKLLFFFFALSLSLSEMCANNTLSEEEALNANKTEDVQEPQKKKLLDRFLSNTKSPNTSKVQKKEVKPVTKSESNPLNIPIPDRFIDEKDIVANILPKINMSTSNRSLDEGDVLELMRVVKANDTTLIGKKVVCEILQRKRSNLSGAEGRIVIRPLYIVVDDEHIMRLLPMDIYRRGSNFSTGKFWLRFVIPFIIDLVAGKGTEIEHDEPLWLRLE